jgi:hypothetical protein
MRNLLVRLWGKKSAAEQAPAMGTAGQGGAADKDDARDRFLEGYRRESAERDRQWHAPPRFPLHIFAVDGETVLGREWPLTRPYHA